MSETPSNPENEEIARLKFELECVKEQLRLVQARPLPLDQQGSLYHDVLQYTLQGIVVRYVGNNTVFANEAALRLTGLSIPQLRDRKSTRLNSVTL